MGVIRKDRERRPCHGRGLKKEFFAHLLQPTTNESNVENDRLSKSRISVLCAILPLELALNTD